MAYNSICFKDLGNFKTGEIFTTYHDSDKFAVSKVGLSELDDLGRMKSNHYDYIDYDVYKNHFEQISTYVCVYFLDKETFSDKLKAFFKA